MEEKLQLSVEEAKAVIFGTTTMMNNILSSVPFSFIHLCGPNNPNRLYHYGMMMSYCKMLDFVFQNDQEFYDLQIHNGVEVHTENCAKFIEQMKELTGLTPDCLLKETIYTDENSKYNALDPDQLERIRKMGYRF